MKLGAEHLIKKKYASGAHKYVATNGRELVQVAYHIIEVGVAGYVTIPVPSRPDKAHKYSINLPAAQQIVKAHERLRGMAVAKFALEREPEKILRTIGFL